MATKSPFSEQATGALSQDIGKAGKFAMQPLHSFEKLAGQLTAKDKAKVDAKNKKDLKKDALWANFKVQVEGKNEVQSKQVKDWYAETNEKASELIKNGSLEEAREFTTSKTMEAQAMQQQFNQSYSQYEKDIASVVAGDSKAMNKDAIQASLGIKYQHRDVNNPTSTQNIVTNAGNFVNAPAVTKAAFSATSNKDYSIEYKNNQIAGDNFKTLQNQTNEFTLPDDMGNRAKNPSEIGKIYVDSFRETNGIEEYATWNALKDTDFKEFLDKNAAEIYSDRPTELARYEENKGLIGEGGIFSNGQWVGQHMGEVELAAYDDYLESKGEGNINSLVDSEIRDLMFAQQTRQRTATTQNIKESDAFSFGSGELDKQANASIIQYNQLIGGLIPGNEIISGNTKRAFDPKTHQVTVYKSSKKSGLTSDDGEEKTKGDSEIEWVESYSYDADLGDDGWTSRHPQEIASLARDNGMKKVTFESIGSYMSSHPETYSVTGITAPTEEVKKTRAAISSFRDIGAVKFLETIFDKSLTEVERKIIGEAKSKDQKNPEFVKLKDKFKSVMLSRGIETKEWTQIYNEMFGTNIDSDLLAE